MTSRLLLAALAMLAVIACITINVYFPEEAIRDLSQQIEAEVEQRASSGPEHSSRRPPRPPSRRATDPSPPSCRSEPPPPGRIRRGAGARDLQPGDPLHHRDPRRPPRGAQPLEDRRRARRNEPRPGGGPRPRGGSRLKERAEVQRLVRDENADREQLFAKSPPPRTSTSPSSTGSAPPTPRPCTPTPVREIGSSCRTGRGTEGVGELSAVTCQRSASPPARREREDAKRRKDAGTQVPCVLASLCALAFGVGGGMLAASRPLCRRPALAGHETSAPTGPR